MGLDKSNQPIETTRAFSRNQKLQKLS